MNMLQTPTGTRDVSGSQKKKGIKSSLGRFFSKKEKVRMIYVRARKNLFNTRRKFVYFSPLSTNRLKAPRTAQCPTVVQAVL
jgi:hypothetical protein